METAFLFYMILAGQLHWDWRIKDGLTSVSGALVLVVDWATSDIFHVASPHGLSSFSRL